MFTTEHYRAIAEVIASHQTNPDHCERCADKRVTLSLLTYDLAGMFERDNPRFKPKTFYRACGFEPTSPEVESEQRAISRSMTHDAPAVKADEWLVHYRNADGEPRTTKLVTAKPVTEASARRRFQSIEEDHGFTLESIRPYQV